MICTESKLIVGQQLYFYFQINALLQRWAIVLAYGSRTVASRGLHFLMQ